METTSILLLLLLVSIFFYPLIHDASEGILGAGHSSAAIRKIKGMYTCKQRFLLHHVMQHCKRYKKHVQVLMVINKVYIVVFSLTLLSSLMSLYWDRLNIVAFYLLIGKGLLLDVPLGVFTLIMSEYDKTHGGKKWKYK
jgi:cation transport ATPase